MSSDDNKETLAVRRALDAFGEALNEELAKLGPAVLEALSGTRHMHVSLVVPTEGRPIVAAVAVQFSSDPRAVEGALALAKAGPSS